MKSKAGLYSFISYTLAFSCFQSVAMASSHSTGGYNLTTYSTNSSDCFSEKEHALRKIKKPELLKISCESHYDGTALILGVDKNKNLVSPVTLIKKDCSSQELNANSFDLFLLNNLDFKLRSRLDNHSQKRTILLITAFSEFNLMASGTLKIDKTDEYLVDCQKIKAN